MGQNFPGPGYMEVGAVRTKCASPSESRQGRPVCSAESTREFPPKSSIRSGPSNGERIFVTEHQRAKTHPKGTTMIPSTMLRFVLSFCFLCCANFGVSAEKQDLRKLTDPEKRLVQSCNDFAFRLLTKVNQAETGKNVFVSPLSVSMALDMALSGADGLTETAMMATLGYAGTTRQEINETSHELMKLLRNLDPRVQVSIANSIWYRRGLTVEPEFIETNQRYYEASVRDLAFVSSEAPRIINTWVDTCTHGKIRRIVPDQIPADAVMYLINAIYFKGTWKYQFDKRMTLDDSFHLIDGSVRPVRFMRRIVFLPYYENAWYQAISLPYGDSLFTMTVVLPKPAESVESFVDGLTQNSWNSLVADLRTAAGTILLPKFKLEYEAGLNDPLKAMGMGAAFDNSANFGRINGKGGFKISEVRHKTFVLVDEEGTEAAAVTSVKTGYSSASGPPREFVMRVDRPFFLAITERHTGAILFVGKVVDPPRDSE